LAALAAVLTLSGCAAPIIGGMTLGTLSTIASVVSVAVTGKDWSDHALSVLTGKDCNVGEGILRKSRKFCEERGSVAAAQDFQGVFVAFGGSGTDPQTRYARARQEELAAASVQPAQPASVVQAQVISPPMIAIFDGVPNRGDAGLARVSGRIVYLMPPIYGSDDRAARISLFRGRAPAACSAAPVFDRQETVSRARSR
jgi:hypothetical protein